MAIECYEDSCPKHASHNCKDAEECEGPICFESECIKNIPYSALSVEDKKIKLLVVTGHELLEPGNQYCKHCGDPMFIEEMSSSACRGEAA
jgi:hypothetical protein